MSQPFPQPSFLALPTFAQAPSIAGGTAASSSSSKGLHLPSGAAAPRKRKPYPNAKSGPQGKRKKSGVNDSRELDERDDVDEADLVGAAETAEGGRGMREMDENYDEVEEDEGDEEVLQVDDGAGVIAGAVDSGVAAAGAGRAGAAGRAGRGGKKGALVDVDLEAVKARGKAMKGDQMALRDVLDPEAAKRFDAFTSVVIPVKAIKKLNREMYDQTADPTLRYMGGLAKIFVAEVVEIAKDLQPRSDHPTGPLKPYHLKLARQVLEERGMLESSTSRDSAVLRPRKSLFRR
ncbi:uncharacterized protein MKK02DRAFT_32591 [Dioszegia hungarica]|uniref:TAFII28-like protein domain-containing protein n=1 Tax=Dioszegia hungarica TaxID=4972 RepID=A0AA38H6U3_9TREE|nr:uncharacterized protein MKK02DRAFT_32591 [Dioszegia hungarica]KAI9635088.1 hypothetical protein MKK02DRAFT_32591 [Dioszegia hungarica]